MIKKKKKKKYSQIRRQLLVFIPKDKLSNLFWSYFPPFPFLLFCISIKQSPWMRFPASYSRAGSPWSWRHRTY